jgi:hypothetical protein
MFIYTIDENPPLVKKIRLAPRQHEPRAACCLAQITPCTWRVGLRAALLPNGKGWVYNQIYRELEIVTRQCVAGKQNGPSSATDDLKDFVRRLSVSSRVTDEHR